MCGEGANLDVLRRIVDSTRPGANTKSGSLGLAIRVTLTDSSTSYIEEYVLTCAHLLLLSSPAPKDTPADSSPSTIICTAHVE